MPFANVFCLDKAYGYVLLGDDKVGVAAVGGVGWLVGQLYPVHQNACQLLQVGAVSVLARDACLVACGDLTEISLNNRHGKDFVFTIIVCHHSLITTTRLRENNGCTFFSFLR